MSPIYTFSDCSQHCSGGLAPDSSLKDSPLTPVSCYVILGYCLRERILGLSTSPSSLNSSGSQELWIRINNDIYLLEFMPMLGQCMWHSGGHFLAVFYSTSYINDLYLPRTLHFQRDPGVNRKSLILAIAFVIPVTKYHAEAI